MDVPKTYVGTISLVKQKPLDSMLGFGEPEYRYKLEILTTEGVILRGVYDDTGDKYKPGDFVRVRLSGDEIEELKVLDRSLMDSHF